MFGWCAVGESLVVEETAVCCAVLCLRERSCVLRDTKLCRSGAFFLFQKFRLNHLAMPARNQPIPTRFQTPSIPRPLSTHFAVTRWSGPNSEEWLAGTCKPGK